MAITAIDRLVDFRTNASDETIGTSSILSKPMDKYEMKKKKTGLGGGEPKQAYDNGKSEAKGREKVLKSSSCCFICKCKHFARDYPKSAQLSAICVEKDGGEITYVNPIRVLDTE